MVVVKTEDQTGLELEYLGSPLGRLGAVKIWALALLSVLIGMAAEPQEEVDLAQAAGIEAVDLVEPRLLVKAQSVAAVRLPLGQSLGHFLER